MKVALIQLPHFYGESNSRPPECYPLGLGYISNVLTEQNIEHVGIDLWGLQYTESQALERIDFSPFDFIGISAYATQYKYLKNFSLALKKKYPEKPIICGGPGPTFSYEIVLKNTGVDVCVIGEGEITIIDLLENYGRFERVKGVAFLRDGRVLCTDRREQLKNLDLLDFPNRQLFDFEKIIETANSVRANSDMPALKDKPRRSADIIAGRGCPYQCNYCSKTFAGLRLRSIDNLVAEVIELKNKYKINHLQFNDELVLVNRNRSLKLCEELKKLNIKWSCQGRIDQVDREILVAMKEAGCLQIGYGVESVSQSILNNMNKRINAEMIVPVIKMTQEAGIEPIIQYMYGYRGENDQTIAATVKFFKEIDHPFVGFTTTLIPGTKLYQEGIQKGLIQDEEDYLLRLDSGYNLNGALINMTDFSDEEYLRKKRLLMMKVSHNYYRKKPWQYGKFIMNIIKGKSKRFLKKGRM
jgi:anaerobic magnesium-protoporphyrin IX monomethyl ester cyclase